MFLFSSFKLSAQESLSVEQYKTRVLNYSTQIKQSQEAVNSSVSDVEAAKKNLLPKLDAAAEFSYLLNKINFDLGGGNKLSYNQLGYGVSATAAQNIYSGGVVRKQIAALETGVEIAVKSVEMTVENINYAAEMSYWKSVAMSSMCKVAEDYLNIIKETYDIVSVRYSDGLISRNDLLMIETRLADAHYQLKDVQKLSKDASISLNILMGVPYETVVLLTDSLLNQEIKLPDYHDLDYALANRANYAISEKKIEAALHALRITKSQYLPKFAIGVTGQYATPSLNFTGEGQGTAVAFAQLKVPIFSWNEKKHKVASSQSQIRASEYQRQGTVDEISKEMATTWSNLINTYDQIDVATKSLSIAEQSLELNTYSYTEGVLTILDVLSSQISWLNAYNSLITTHFSYVQAEAAYKKALGFY